jgi:hypothetical protein
MIRNPNISGVISRIKLLAVTILNIAANKKSTVQHIDVNNKNKTLFGLDTVTLSLGMIGTVSGKD